MGVAWGSGPVEKGAATNLAQGLALSQEGIVPVRRNLWAVCLMSQGKGKRKDNRDV